MKRPPSGYALFTSDGRRRGASESWPALVQRELPPGTVWNADRVFAALGWEGSGGRYSREGNVYTGEVTPMGDLMLVSLYRPPGRESYEAFLRVAAHDVRGPLANVRSYASLLLSPRFALDEKVKKGLETIGRNSDRALALVQSLVDLWRFNEGGLLLERSQELLRPLIDKAAARVQGEAERRGVGLTLDLPGELPSVLVDPDRIVVALTGLFCNALERSGRQSTVRVSARPDAGGVAVSTLDGGPQLTPDALARAFDFAGAAVEARKLDARFDLGLGAVLVAAHAGRCEAARVEGNQTRFTFWIPCGETTRPSPEPHPGRM